MEHKPTISEFRASQPEAYRYIVDNGLEHLFEKHFRDCSTTIEKVIEQFKKVHGERYDYSKVNYVGTHVKVEIICKEHGHIFLKTPSAHKLGEGCPKCSGFFRPKTIKDLVEVFKSIHGDKYDYSKVEYDSSSKMCRNVEIICKEHGPFFMAATIHKQGSGCNKCRGFGFTTKEIIKQFKDVHGDIYDYSKVVYVNATKKVEIICKEHGPFLQIVRKHRSGSGCLKCVGKGLTFNDVIKQFKDVHGDRYDYSKVVYVNANTKVEIICKEHGPFLQAPIGHTSGKGCSKCGIISRGINRRTALNEVVEHFKDVHGDRYDYSKVVYVNTNTNIEIICKEHGPFFQSPRDHKAGRRCPKCAGRILNTDDVIKQFKDVHGDRYDYSKVVYVHSNTKVEIICKEHGPFLQSPDGHKRGQGCSKCSSRHRWTLKN